MTRPFSKFERGDDHYLAYRHIPGDSPGILFCPGFHSDMQGNKAIALEDYCRKNGRQFTSFDYFGHGQSSGAIEEGTVGRWREDTLAILDGVTQGPQVIVGSSMGGWMMLLVALERPDRITALLGIASAPDMTGEHQKRLDQEQLRSLAEHGWYDLPNEYDDRKPYRIRQEFLDEAESHFLLRAPIPITVPVRLVHGLQDTDVPWERSMTLARRLQSEDVFLHLLKSGDHRLSTPGDLKFLTNSLNQLLHDYG
jgi:pimeloyl-ACP methyl ester carboxylesterase